MEKDKGPAVKIVTLTTLLLFIFKDAAKITLLIASGIARYNRVNLSPLAARLEAVVLPPRSPPAWVAFGLPPPAAGRRSLQGGVGQGQVGRGE